MQDELLKLENQICFPLYAASRLVIKLYQPHLSKADITYPQYLVFLLLWEKDHRNVGDISTCLFLESNTLTPLLKRMEAKGYIDRKRSKHDERSVIVSLTETGKSMKSTLGYIPEAIINSVKSDKTGMANIVHLKETLSDIMDALK